MLPLPTEYALLAKLELGLIQALILGTAGERATFFLGYRIVGITLLRRRILAGLGGLATCLVTRVRRFFAGIGIGIAGGAPAPPGIGPMADLAPSVSPIPPNS